MMDVLPFVIMILLKQLDGIMLLLRLTHDIVGFAKTGLDKYVGFAKTDP